MLFTGGARAMSYEGREQIICEDGHYSEIDAFYAFVTDQGLEAWRCPAPCNKRAVWTNSIDETNCDAYGEVELTVKEPPKSCRCRDCGDKHIVMKATYHIPEGGHRLG